MQSTPVSSFASNIPSQILKQSYFQQQSYRETNDLTIEYSGSGGDLFLQMSTDISYSATTYTEKGYMPSESPLPSEPLTPSVSGDTESSSGVPGTGQMYDMVLQKYYEMILERVEYLLGEMNSNQDAAAFNSSESDGENLSPAHSTGSAVIYSESLSVSKSLTISGTITDADYFSAEKTADRIISFALSFYDGGDREEYANMVRSAVMKGFDQAMSALGGTLPQLSFDTINMVNHAIDEFAAVEQIDINV